MALESCKVLILSDYIYYSVRLGDKRCDGNRKFLEHGGTPTQVLDRPIDTELKECTVDLMPINLVKFNTETETEE